MASIEEELLMDAEENAREAQYILNTIPNELKEKYTENDILLMMDYIIDYYVTSGVLDGNDEDDYVEIDLQKVAEHVCKKAKEEEGKDYDPAEVFFVAQADFDFQEEESE